VSALREAVAVPPTVGSLNRLVEFRGRELDGSFRKPLSLWARVRTVEKRGGMEVISVVVRRRADIKPLDRLLHSDRSFVVESAEGFEGQEPYLVLICRRGCVVATIEGDPTVLWLNETGLVTIEGQLGKSALLEIAQHVAEKMLSGREVTAVLEAAFATSGLPRSRNDVARLVIEGAIQNARQVASDLVEAALADG